MTAKKRRAHRRLPPIPLGELPMMKALLALAGPLGTGKTAVKPPTKGDPKTQLATLTRTIADKLQVLALRRPRALIIVAQIVDKLLDQQLEALLDVKQNRSPRKTANGVARTRRDPSQGSSKP